MAARKPPRRTPAAQFARDFDTEKRSLFLQHLRQGMMVGAACDAVFGENNPTRRRLCRDYIDGHDEFFALVTDAQCEATEHVEEALYQAAVSGNVNAAIKWLELRGAEFPEHRGRPPKPKEPEQVNDPMGDLGNVSVLDPRKRRSQRET